MCVNVTIINDDIYEVDETFLVTISTDDSQVVVQPEQEVVNVTIIDKDGKCVSDKHNNIGSLCPLLLSNFQLTSSKCYCNYKHSHQLILSSK